MGGKKKQKDKLTFRTTQPDSQIGPLLKGKFDCAFSE